MTTATIDAAQLQSLAADIVDDGVQAAKRAIESVQHRVAELSDLKDDAATRVKHQPFIAVAIAGGVGLVLGIAVAWIGGRLGKPSSPCNG